MKMAHEFTVPVDVKTAWDVLTDLERIAPCMPGAKLTGRDGEDYLGQVKVKVGPVTTTFAGQARFIERDDNGYRAVIEAKGKDARGGGNANATITAELRAEADDRTVVSVDTDLKISGKLAQFGSGMITEVSNKLLGQFVSELERVVVNPEEPAPAAAEPASAANSTAPTAAAGTAQPAAEPDAVDLTELAGPAVIKRLVPLVGVVAVLLLVLALRRRRG